MVQVTAFASSVRPAVVAAFVAAAALAGLAFGSASLEGSTTGAIPVISRGGHHWDGVPTPKR